MNVLHVVNAYPTEQNGVKGIFIKEQINSIKNQDKNINHDILFIDKNSDGYYAYLKALFFLLKNASKYDVIHAHHVLCAFIVIISGHKCKAVTSYLSDSYNEVMLGPVFIRKFIYNFVFRNSLKSIFKLRNEYIDDINRFYIPNAVDMDFFNLLDKEKCKKELNLDSESTYALFISGQNLFRPEKRYDLFLNIINEYNSKFNKKIIPIALEDANREQLLKYYNAVDFYLLTSDFEGSPNAVKECLACHKSVIARDVGSISELLYELEGCYIVPYNDPISSYMKAIDMCLATKNNINYTRHLKNLGLDLPSTAIKIISIYRSIYEKK